MSKKGLNLKKSDKSPGSQPNLIKIGTCHKIIFLGWVPSGKSEIQGRDFDRKFVQIPGIQVTSGARDFNEKISRSQNFNANDLDLEL